MSEILDIARRVIADEAAALSQLADGVGESLAAAVESLLKARQIIVSGLGKSGVIAQKIAASLTSTGAPAVYLHPVEALHGDLGIVTRDDCLIALSRSGATEEVLRFATHFRRLGGPILGVTQGRESKLAEISQHTLLLPDLPEAGPLALAPTTSCVMMLAVGDALAMALLHARGFRPSDFAQFHPEGSLGRRLLLRAEDLMHQGAELPIVRAEDTFESLLVEMTDKRLGLALVVQPDGVLLGTFTDGDLRRIFQRVDTPRRLSAREACERSRRDTADPVVRVSAIEPHTPAVECLRMMQDSQITHLVVEQEGRPVGLLRLMDLIAAGLA
jgi:arabinose-5-phosphate isomerase